MTAAPTRVSLFRYSPALILFAIVIADARQLSDPDLWGHVLWGRELLAHGSLPRGNPYSYSAPGYLWLRHEWLSEVLMGSIFDHFGPMGLKLLKFACTAGTLCFVVLAMSETAAPVLVQAPILLIVALMLVPVIQFRPTMFDFLSLSAIVALLSRHNWRGSAPLWLAIPIVAIWSNLHGGFFVGIIVMGVYGVNCPAGRRPCRRGTASRAWHYCDYRRRCRIYLVHVSDPARARHLVHAHPLDHEPDDALRDRGLETADRRADNPRTAAASRRSISSWCCSFLAPPSYQCC